MSLLSVPPTYIKTGVSGWKLDRFECGKRSSPLRLNVSKRKSSTEPWSSEDRFPLGGSWRREPSLSSMGNAGHCPYSLLQYFFKRLPRTVDLMGNNSDDNIKTARSKAILQGEDFFQNKSSCTGYLTSLPILSHRTEFVFLSQDQYRHFAIPLILSRVTKPQKRLS